MTAVVLTANFGGHDEPTRVPAAQDIDVDWLYYTDGPDDAPAPWVTIREAGRFGHPNLDAKLYKACPPVEARDVIWIDANMAITSPTFAREALRSRVGGIAAWRHPRRTCIYDEALASVEGREAQGGKYSGFDLAAQVASYQAEGYPEHNGLYACGTIAYDLRLLHSSFGPAWLNECLRWSPQDQLSFPVVAWRLGIKPGVFPYPQVLPRRRTERHPWRIRNQWMTLYDHVPA